MADLIVEDGTGVVNANSYVSIEDAHAYAEARGFDDKFSNDDDLSAWLFRAMDYLEGITNYQGVTSYTDQFLLWPRNYVYLDGSLYNRFLIPKQLKAAQIQLALAQANGVDLVTRLQAEFGNIQKEKVGPLETTYFSAFDYGALYFTQIDTLLGPLLSSYLGTLRTVRV